jgi:hypothetical protein
MSRSVPVRIRGPRDLARLSARSQEAFLNAAEVVTEARRNGTTIAQELERQRRQGVRVSRASVRRYFGHDLERGPGGWIVPKLSDRSYHGDLRVISTEGVLPRSLRGSGARRLVAEHANAVKAYLRGDDPDGEGLGPFSGRRVGGVELETDRDQLDELWRQGELDDFSDGLYVDRAA